MPQKSKSCTSAVKMRWLKKLAGAQNALEIKTNSLHMIQKERERQRKDTEKGMIWTKIQGSKVIFISTLWVNLSGLFFRLYFLAYYILLYIC